MTDYGGLVNSKLFVQRHQIRDHVLVRVDIRVGAVAVVPRVNRVDLQIYKSLKFQVQCNPSISYLTNGFGFLVKGLAQAVPVGF